MTTTDIPGSNNRLRDNSYSIHSREDLELRCNQFELLLQNNDVYAEYHAVHLLCGPAIARHIAPRANYLCPARDLHSDEDRLDEDAESSGNFSDV